MAAQVDFKHVQTHLFWIDVHVCAFYHTVTCLHMTLACSSLWPLWLEMPPSVCAVCVDMLVVCRYFQC